MCTPREREITFWTHYKGFNQIYCSERHIDLDEIALAEEAWLTTVLRKMSADSNVNRFYTSQIWAITTAIDVLRNVPHGWFFCQINEKNITPEIMRTVFYILEYKLVSSAHTNESKRQISGKFRSTVLKTNFQAVEQISAETVKFKTTLGNLKHTPQDILNIKDHLNSLHMATPLGAVPHRNYLDLIEKSSDLLQSDLNKVIGACITDLAISKKNRSIIIQTESIPLRRDQKERIGKILYKATSSLTKATTDSNPPEIIIAAYRQTISEKSEKSGNGATINFHALDQNSKELGIELPLGYSGRQTFFSPERITTIELQSIFILLLCRTGWNRDSLIEMNRDGIVDDEPGFAYVLQGFKTKTDDDTPPIFIEHTEKEVINAINLLVWGYEQLRKLGLVESGNKKLWYSWTNSDSFLRSSTMIQMKPYDFMTRNRLFDFSLKQIRSTVLSIDAYRSRSYEAARQRGGHSSLGTTGRYLDHIITRSIASSINLQFQSDLEKKVAFNLNARKNGSKNFIRIGDGSMCADPYSGLYDDNGADRVCSAQHCNENGGCPNRRIMVNEESIVDIIQTREYYFKHWQRLRNDNPTKFNTLIAPKIIFNDALYKFVKNSRYGHVLAEIEEALMCRESSS